MTPCNVRIHHNGVFVNMVDKGQARPALGVAVMPVSSVKGSVCERSALGTDR